MKSQFILFVLLSFMIGCAGIQTPVGTLSASKQVPTKPAPVKPKKKSFKESTGMSPAVGTLMFIGGLAMVLTLPVATTADFQDPIIPLIIFGSGLTLWGAAGIIYLVE